MNERKLGYIDVTVGLILLTIGSFMAIEAVKMPKLGPVYVAPGMFPLIIGILLAILAILLIIPSLIAELTNKILANQLIAFTRKWKANLNSKKLIGTIIMLAAYIVSFNYFNYVISTAAFLLLMMFIFKATSITRVVIVSLAATGVVTYLFGTIFRLPLP